jgi:hypothetical protein
VTLSIAPEVLPVAVPFLCIQPLVENAVRHGLERAERVGHIRIVARDRGQECVIEVEDDGAGEDPEKVRRRSPATRARLGRARQRRRAAAQRVRRRLRAGRRDRPGAGTKVVVRVPKFAPGCTHDPRPRLLAVLGRRRRAPALDELAYLLGRDPRVGEVLTSDSATEALRILQDARSTRSSSTSRCPG